MTSHEIRAHGDANRECRVLTIFTSDKEGHKPQPTERAEEKRDKRVLNSPRNEEPILRQTWLVKVNENIVQEPWCIQVPVQRLETEEHYLRPLIYVKISEIPIGGIFPTGHSRVKPSTRQSSQPT